MSLLQRCVLQQMFRHSLCIIWTNLEGKPNNWFSSLYNFQTFQALTRCTVVALPKHTHAHYADILAFQNRQPEIINVEEHRVNSFYCFPTLHILYKRPVWQSLVRLKRAMLFFARPRKGMLTIAIATRQRKGKNFTQTLHKLRNKRKKNKAQKTKQHKVVFWFIKKCQSYTWQAMFNSNIVKGRFESKNGDILHTKKSDFEFYGVFSSFNLYLMYKNNQCWICKITHLRIWRPPGNPEWNEFEPMFSGWFFKLWRRLPSDLHCQVGLAVSSLLQFSVASISYKNLLTKYYFPHCQTV